MAEKGLIGNFDLSESSAHGEDELDLDLNLDDNDEPEVKADEKEASDNIEIEIEEKPKENKVEHEETDIKVSTDDTPPDDEDEIEIEIDIPDNETVETNIDTNEKPIKTKEDEIDIEINEKPTETKTENNLDNDEDEIDIEIDIPDKETEEIKPNSNEHKEESIDIDMPDEKQYDQKVNMTETVEKPLDKAQALEEVDKYLDQKDKEFGDNAVEEIQKHLDVKLNEEPIEVITFEDSQEFKGEKSITDENNDNEKISADSEHDENDNTSNPPAKVVEVDGKKIEISVGKGEQMDKEKLEEKRVQAIKDIKSKAKQLADRGLEFDASIYDQQEEIDKFLRMIVGCMIVPSNSVSAEAQTLHLEELEHWKIPTDEFIQKVSFYSDFKCFQAPPENLLHSSDEILVICQDLNKLFQFNFLDIHSTDFQFNEIPSRILKFTNKYTDLKTTAFEENFLKAVYGKIEILLNTNVEAAFRSNSIKITPEFWTAFGGYLKEMEQIQGRKEKLRASWNEFIVALFSMRVKNQIYRHVSYSNLNEMLNTCYQPDGFLLIEQLVGNSLKCYFPTIIRSYFFMIRSVYMMARLVAIYSFLKLHKGKSKEEVRKDIYEIGAICTIAYETKYHMWKSEERAPIHGLNNEEISPQVQEYARNHVINGGQYFLLKSIETALPVIASSLQ